MNEKVRETWVKPLITGVASGSFVSLIFLYIGAYATGVTLRSPFSLSWIIFIFSARIPLWGVFLIAATIVIVTLILRERAENKPIIARVDAQGDAMDSRTNAPTLKAEPRISSPEPSGIEATHERDSVSIESKDSVTAKFSVFEEGSRRGIRLIVENYRLMSVHQVRIVMLNISSFDSRHQAYREPVLSGRVLNRPTGIRPSSSSQPVDLIWKDRKHEHLVTGEGNVAWQLAWPDRDKSDVEKWKIAMTIVAYPVSSSPNEPSTPLPELVFDLVILWNRASNRFSFQRPDAAAG